VIFGSLRVCLRVKNPNCRKDVSKSFHKHMAVPQVDSIHSEVSPEPFPNIFGRAATCPLRLRHAAKHQLEWGFVHSLVL